MCVGEGRVVVVMVVCGSGSVGVLMRFVWWGGVGWGVCLGVWVGG